MLSETRNQSLATRLESIYREVYRRYRDRFGEIPWPEFRSRGLPSILNAPEFERRYSVGVSQRDSGSHYLSMRRVAGATPLERYTPEDSVLDQYRESPPEEMAIEAVDKSLAKHLEFDAFLDLTRTHGLLELDERLIESLAKAMRDAIPERDSIALTYVLGEAPGTIRILSLASEHEEARFLSKMTSALRLDIGRIRGVLVKGAKGIVASIE